MNETIIRNYAVERAIQVNAPSIIINEIETHVIDINTLMQMKTWSCTDFLAWHLELHEEKGL